MVAGRNKREKSAQNPTKFKIMFNTQNQLPSTPHRFYNTYRPKYEMYRSQKLHFPQLPMFFPSTQQSIKIRIEISKSEFGKIDL
jgi:hypothetical protein